MTISRLYLAYISPISPAWLAQLGGARERGVEQQGRRREGRDRGARQVVEGAPAQADTTAHRHRTEAYAERREEAIERRHVGATRAAHVVHVRVLVGVPQLGREIQGRYRRDIGEIQGRHGGDMRKV